MDNGSNPLITIGIPTYNRLRYLQEAVASARAQSYPNIEIIISQNPHRDPKITTEIAEYCRAQEAQDPRVRYRIHQRNVGPEANFNSLADEARGSYVSLFGDDDRLLPHAIESLVKALEPNCVMVFAKRHFIDRKGRRVEELTSSNDRRLGFDRLPAGRVENMEYWAWRQSPMVENSLTRTSDMRRLRFREDIDMPDVELYIRLAREGGTFIFLPEYVIEYRWHSDSTTGGGFRDFSKLADLLAGLEVSAEVEPAKRQLLEGLIYEGVRISLLRGETDQARELASSGYYPVNNWMDPKQMVMNACIGMPGKWGSYVYNALHALKKGQRFDPSYTSARN
jgi:glycosyltransferase involved in cell wall biosynthesis